MYNVDPPIPDAVTLCLLRTATFINSGPKIWLIRKGDHRRLAKHTYPASRMTHIHEFHPDSIDHDYATDVSQAAYGFVLNFKEVPSVTTFPTYTVATLKFGPYLK
jgi:hypothetical protein